MNSPPIPPPSPSRRPLLRISKPETPPSNYYIQEPHKSKNLFGNAGYDDRQRRRHEIFTAAARAGAPFGVYKALWTGAAVPSEYQAYADALRETDPEDPLYKPFQPDKVALEQRLHHYAQTMEQKKLGAPEIPGWFRPRLTKESKVTNESKMTKESQLSNITFVSPVSIGGRYSRKDVRKVHQRKSRLVRKTRRVRAIHRDSDTRHG